MEPFMCFRRQLLTSCPVSVEFKEVDGASGNEKLIAHWVQTEREKTPGQPMSQTVVCRNHRTHLIAVHASSIVGAYLGSGLSLINDLYACALFFSMSGQFIRVMMAAKPAVQKHFQLLSGHPPAWVPLRNAELKDSCVSAIPQRQIATYVFQPCTWLPAVLRRSSLHAPRACFEGSEGLT